MKLSRSDLVDFAQDTGFDPGTLEKVIHLVNLLNHFKAHPYLKSRWALKGGTALNLFVLDLPRLSVDIDLNYIGAIERESMVGERPKIEQAVQAVFAREGLTVRRMPTSHAGGKWVLRYRDYDGHQGNLEVDMNFMFRQPLWSPVLADSIAIGPYRAADIRILNHHELAAGKLAALFGRTQARDLFDCRQILKNMSLDHRLLRIAFTVYGGMNTKDWRTISIDGLSFDPRDISGKLLQTLRNHATTPQIDPVVFGQSLIEDCHEGLSSVLPLADNELEFLNLLLEEGSIDASLLTTDDDLRERIDTHPMLQWRAFNVRKRKGFHSHK